jgi:predicted NBD/HSP70 family sugar kinase
MGTPPSSHKCTSGERWGTSPGCLPAKGAADQRSLPGGQARPPSRTRYGREVTGNPTPRDYNKASVLEVLLSRAPMTRHELIERTGLSKATVSRVVGELRADGCVINGGVDEVTGRGRRSTYLDVPGTMGHVVGISFGMRTTCVLVADLRGREVRHVIVPTMDHDELLDAAEWLVGLMAETSKSAEGPLRQIVAAVPGRVRSGTEIFGPAESMKPFAGSGLQRKLAEMINAPVLLDSDANASLLGILNEDPTIRDAALLSMSSILNVASCIDRELLRRRTPTFGDIGVLSSGVGNELLDGLLSTSGLLRFARGRGLNLERIEDLWLQPHHEVTRAEVLDAFTTAVVTAVICR